MTSIVASKKAIVKQRILSGIQSGKYSAGQKLAGEIPLAKKFGVSQSTVHLVLNELAREGLVERINGSGTYVKASNRDELIIKVPVIPSEEKKIVFKHFWGKLIEHGSRWSLPVVLKKVPYHNHITKWDAISRATRLFTEADPVGGFGEITANQVAWLAQLGLCEDLTAQFSAWSQADNIYPIAREAVMYENRIYGIPFTSTLTGFTYHSGCFDAIGMAPEDAVGSIDGFMHAAERLAQRSELKYTFWGPTIRNLLMHLLRAFYPNLAARFTLRSFEPLDSKVAGEVLNIIHRLRWKYRAALMEDSKFREHIRDIGRGQIAMGIMSCYPEASFADAYEGCATQLGIGFLPCSWGADQKPFSLYNACVYIINPNADKNVRDFWWTALKHYIQPQSVSEIDRRYVEEGQVNNRFSPFISLSPRVPRDPKFDRQQHELFQCAELEVPFPSPAFDTFVTAARRLIHDPDARPEKEYEFYLTLLASSENPEINHHLLRRDFDQIH